MADATAFISWGRWVADCPACGNARVITLGDVEFVCVPPPAEGGCGVTSPLVWPDKATQEMAAMAGRPAAEQSGVVPGSPQDAPPVPDATATNGDSLEALA